MNNPLILISLGNHIAMCQQHFCIVETVQTLCEYKKAVQITTA